MNAKFTGYKIVSEIGSGGMATVYLAIQQSLERPVALKVIHAHLCKDAIFRERFINEAKVMSRLRHPNIVQVYDFSSSSKGLMFAMEYIKGRGLDDMIGEEYGPIPYQKALPMFSEMLQGVGYAHSRGVIHRDIKPSNILVSNQKEVRISDFGIAKIVGQEGLTRTGTQMGTVYYESPEQLQGARDVDHRADIYSLGVTLYEMLAGQLPFDSVADTSEFQIMNEIINRKVMLNPIDHYPHIPSWLVKIVQKATSIDPEDRFQSCVKFQEAIDSYYSTLDSVLNQSPKEIPPDEASDFLMDGYEKPVKEPPNIMVEKGLTNDAKGKYAWKIGIPIFAALILVGILIFDSGESEREAKYQVEETQHEAIADNETIAANHIEREPEMIRASHILIAYQGAARATANRSQEEARQLGEELSGLIEGDNLSFEQAAAEYSDCPSGAQGGGLGSFGRGSMVPAFEEAAFSLEPGEVSGIVETEFGYHLIKRTE